MRDKEELVFSSDLSFLHFVLLLTLGFFVLNDYAVPAEGTFHNSKVWFVYFHCYSLGYTLHDFAVDKYFLCIFEVLILFY